MDRFLLYVSLFVIAVLGVGIVLCAFHILSEKTKRLSIWKMPRLRLAVLAGACVVATIAAQKSTGVRYVDANAPAGGNGLSWNTAARTIDEVSRDLSGGTIYVKPGTYGAFSYWTVGDYMSSNPLEIIATGGIDETIINGKMSPMPMAYRVQYLLYRLLPQGLFDRVCRWLYRLHVRLTYKV